MDDKDGEDPGVSDDAEAGLDADGLGAGDAVYHTTEGFFASN